MSTLKRFLLAGACLIAGIFNSPAQVIPDTATQNPDDLFNLLDADTVVKAEYIQNAFKTIKIINAQSIERLAPGSLNLMIQHRFGPVSSGSYNLWGLDNATMKLEFDYGLFSWLTIGLGRTTFAKVYDGYFKASLMRQQKGKHNIPVSVLYYADMAYTSQKWVNSSYDYRWYHRMAYTHQLIVGSKLNERISLQLMPTLVHRNMVPLIASQNLVASIGYGGRVKLGKRIAITFEGFYPVTKTTYPGITYYNPFSIGVDIETGGHVFQLQFTNATAMHDNGFINETMGRWSKGDILFGFNLNREFFISKNKKTNW